MKITFLFLFTALLQVLPAQDVFRCQNGKIDFRSEAPLEVIEAQCSELKGIIDPAKMTFAWSVKVNAFKGFNSGLQRDHFQENYMETARFPTATFTGKIIESIDLSKNQKTTVRAKGKLNIHGVERERIIKIDLEIKEKEILITSFFSVSLEDHNISIPRIVNQKIAESVNINVSATLLK